MRTSVSCKLGRLLDVVLIQHTSLQSAQGLSCFADPGIDLFDEGIITGNATSDTLEFCHSLYLCSVDGDG